jgi:hypothetical protein
MRKATVSAIALLFLCAAVFAQNGTPSAKAGATIRNLICVYGADAYDQWLNVGDPITIKMNNVNDLFIGASLETGLYTLTRVSTKLSSTGTPLESKAEATAGVKVRVVLDNNEAVLIPPGEVTFDQRIQTLSATLGQALTGCSINTDTGLVECTGLTNQEIQLILDTLGAHTFNFVKTNVGTGVHTLQVQYKLNKNALDDGVSSTAIGKACAGLGTVTVQSVRMANYIELQ